MIKRILAASLTAAILAAALPAARPAWAQDNYPNKPVRVIVSFAVGGSADIIARLLSAKFSELTGQQFLVENKPGAGGNIGTEIVAKAAPDGYTLMLGSASPFAFNPGVYKTMPFEPVKDFTQIGQAGITNYAFVVNKNVPIKDVKELIAAARAQPGKLTYGTPGIGTVPHICTEQFKKLAGGVDITHVPYRGAGPVMNDLVAGQITMAFDAVPTSIPQIQGGAIRLIANGSATRARAFPDTPTVAEQGVAGFDCYVWFGLFGPAKLPAPIVAKLNATLNAALKDPAVAKRLADLNIEMLPHTTPEAFARYVQAEYDKWVPIGRASGATLD